MIALLTVGQATFGINLRIFGPTSIIFIIELTITLIFYLHVLLYLKALNLGLCLKVSFILKFIGVKKCEVS